MGGWTVHRANPTAVFAIASLRYGNFNPKIFLMTVNEPVHDSADVSFDDRVTLETSRDIERMNLAIAEALEDVSEGRVYSSEAFLRKWSSAGRQESPRSSCRERMG